MLPRFTVILAAGGSSARFGRDKLLADLSGTPVIARTIAAFIGRDDVAELLIATNNRDAIEATLLPSVDRSKLAWCASGATRADTVQIAAAAAKSEWVAVHDAARPLVSADVIDRVFAAARSHGAAAPALAVTLTIKRATGPLPAAVAATVPRQDLWAMQTPQAMRRSDLLTAFATSRVPLADLTDDLQALENAGVPVTLVAGDEANLKLTHAVDLALAALLLNER